MELHFKYHSKIQECDAKIEREKQVRDRAATIHFPTIRYISSYKGHVTIHDTIHYCARQK